MPVPPNKARTKLYFRPRLKKASRLSKRKLRLFAPKITLARTLIKFYWARVWGMWPVHAAWKNCCPEACVRRLVLSSKRWLNVSESGLQQGLPPQQPRCRWKELRALKNAWLLTWRCNAQAEMWALLPVLRASSRKKRWQGVLAVAH